MLVIYRFSKNYPACVVSSMSSSYWVRFFLSELVSFIKFPQLSSEILVILGIPSDGYFIPLIYIYFFCNFTTCIEMYVFYLKMACSSVYLLVCIYVLKIVEVFIPVC